MLLLYIPITESSVVRMSTVKRSNNNAPTVPCSTHHFHGVIRELDGYGFSDVLYESVHLVFLGDTGRSLKEFGHLLVGRVLSQNDDVATRLVGRFRGMEKRTASSRDSESQSEECSSR